MPTLTTLPILGNLKFFAAGLVLPVGHTRPTEGAEAEMYDAAFKPEERVATPTLLPPWFRPAETSNALQQEACDRIGGGMKELHDTMLDAVRYAHGLWKLQAAFRGLQIAGVAAAAGPGCLSGPQLEPLIKSYPACAGWQGNKAKHRDAVARGVSVCFKRWQDAVTLPGLPWYPVFLMVPSPVAPPMPNVPVPLIACASAAMAEIVQPQAMAREMSAALDGGLKDQDPDRHHVALHEAIATVLSISFLVWLGTQLVAGVMGTGPVPTFAPPFVPAGPVVGGSTLPTLGHLAT